MVGVGGVEDCDDVGCVLFVGVCGCVGWVF